MNFKIIDHAFHPNGVSGAPFTTVRFTDDGWDMLAILFETKGHCAVFSITRLRVGLNTFGDNSFRGDHYERLLRKAIAKLKQASDAEHIGGKGA